MKKLLFNKTRFTYLFCSMFFLLLGSNASWGQQTIGSFPYMDGGFEGQTATTTLSGSGVSTSAWTVSSSTNSSVRSIINDATAARSGSKYAAHASSTATVRLQSPSTATAANAPAPNAQHTIQYYYKTTTNQSVAATVWKANTAYTLNQLVSNAGNVYTVTTAGTSGAAATAPVHTSGAAASGTATLTYYTLGNQSLQGSVYNDSGNSKSGEVTANYQSGVWTKATYTGTTNVAAVTASANFAAVRHLLATTSTVNIDDFVVYAGGVDTTAPTAANLPTSSVASSTTFNIGWTATTDADRTGFMVVRYASDPSANAAAAPNVNGIYGLNNTIPNGNATGTVVYIGTDTSFIDTVTSTGTQTYYRIFSVDKAFNYSAPLDLATVLTPIIGAPSVVSLTGFSYVEGAGPSSVQSFTISGADLTSSLVLTVADPTIFEINNPAANTTYGSTITLASGTVASTTINVRLKAGLAISSYDSKIINITSTGATSKSISCSGSVIAFIDTTPPATPGLVTLDSKTTTTANLSWTASSTTGIDLTGYMLVRYSGSTSAAGVNPVNGTTYAVGDTYSTGATPKTATVLYVGTNLSFTDTNLVSGSSYYYKVYAYDVARNYSTPSSDVAFKVTTFSLLSTPVATAATSTGTSGFDANWQHIVNADSYSLSVYTNPGVQSNIVGWTFPTSWTGASGYLVTADVANSNNTAKQFSLSTGTLSSANGVTTSAASGSTFHSQSGTITAPVKWFQVDVNAVGYKDIKVSSSMYANAATSARDFKLQYSITGPTGTFTDVTGGAITCVNGSWVPLTDLALPAECENASNLSLRWMQVGFLDTAGNVMYSASSSTRIDNIYVKGSALSVVSGYPVTVAVTGSPAAGSTLTSSRTVANPGTYYYDVVANPISGSLLYTSSYKSNFISVDIVDNTPPASPGAVTVNAATSGLAINWVAATSVEGGGYMVVRYGSNPNANNDPTQKTAYVAGNTFTNGTGSLTGTVVYVGTNVTATDTNLSSGTTYYYKVYTFDQATNYSDESSASGTTPAATLAAPVATASSIPTSTGFTANWDAVTNATNYSLNLYTANTQSNLVGWTFPVSGTTLTADITSANNLTNTLVQSSGTVSSGTGATTQAISAASWYNVFNKYWEVPVNTSGNYNIKVSSKLLSTGPRDFKLQYKIGSTGTYTDVPNGAFVCANDWTTGVLKDISLPAECDNQASVFLRWINYTAIDYSTGLAMTGGTARLDDIYITGSTLTSESGYPITLSGTSKVISGLTAGIHYYDVVANGNGVSFSSSPKSNVIASSIVPPVSPGAVTVNGATASSLAVSWIAASRIDGGGYMVVRYASNPNADNDPTQRITYVAGNTYTSGTGSLTGTVVYVGTALTFSNTALSPGTNYYYKVYAFDQDYDYSSESSASGTTSAAVLTAPVATASSAPTTTGFTANWGAVTNASNYDLYLYDANTPSTIVGWNFDTNLIATTTSTNNTNNAVVQSKGTAQLGTVSSNTCVSATSSAWTPSGTAPNLVASGTNWEIVVNTVGYRNTTVSSKMYASQAATAARDFKVQYKIGSTGTYTDVPSGAIIVARDWTTGVLEDLALPAACDNQASVYLRWINYTTLATDGVNTITSGGISLDDVYVKGNALNIESGYPINVSGTSKVLTGLASGVHYYDVIAKGDGVAYTSSTKSNTITAAVIIAENIADYKSNGNVTISSAANWLYYNAQEWLTATAAPTSANNITVSSGNVLTLGANLTVASGKKLTVNGTLDLASYTISGAGSFTLKTAGTAVVSSAANYATLKLGNNTSIATGITTTTSNFETATNYVYNGVGVTQNFSSLPSTISGNITISNTTGVYLVNHTAINAPGLVSVAAGAKLWFGDGAVSVAGTTAGTYNLTGSGAFSAGNGCTLVVTGSKGLSYRSGNMSLEGTRTWGTDINFWFYKNDGYTVMQMGDLFATNSLNLQSPTTPEITSINNLEVNNPYGVYLGCINPAKNPLNSGYTSGTTVNGMITDYAPLTDINIKGNLNFISGKLIANKGTLKLNAAGNAAVSFTAADGTTRVTSVPTDIGTASVIVAGSITGAGIGTTLPNGYTDGKWVVGNLKKLTTSGNSPSFSYPIGDATSYCPLALNFSGNTTANGGLTARSYSVFLPNTFDSSIDDTKKVNRNWSLTNTNLAGIGTYQATFRYASTDNDPGTTPSSYVVRRFDNDTWSNVTISGTPTATTTIATGLTGFGNFVIGQNINAVQNATAQSFCGSATVADLVPYSGTSYKWYATATGGTALDASAALTTGTYYVAMTIFGGSETSRTAVPVTVNVNTNASIVNVSTIAELQSAINTSNCGDIIVLANGRYTNTTLDIGRSNITVKAATNGDVYFDGTNDINITGNNVKFKGFQFTSGDIGANYLIEVSGSHNTLSQLNFNGYRAKKFIVILEGSQYNTVEYSNISKLADDNKDELGCAIQIHTSYSTPGYHKIRYCSFKDFAGAGGDYGNEPIRIGLSTENANKSRSIVEYCYFNNTGLGDSETISIKSQENTIRFCTFTNQQNAHLCFRNGNNNVAYSNFFIGAGGIRVKEANNIYCYNNYFQNSGTTDATVSNRANAVTYFYDTSTYPVVLNNINFVHNTFYNCANIDFGGIGATNNTWANNIFKKEGTIFMNPNNGTTFAGNIYQGTPGITIASGMTSADPLLVTNSDGYFGLSTGSPAIDSSTSSYPAILTIPNINDDASLLFDISGQSRPPLATLKDVGCDEFTTGAITNHPLVVTEVGPTYLGGPVTLPPTATAQTFCNSGTVANLVATGTAIKWYSSEASTSVLSSTTALATGTYYATQTINNIESDRTAVSVTIQALPASAGTNGILKICAGTSVSESTLFAALGGTPATGGTWSATTGGAGTYTYTQAATSPCTTPNTATVTVTEQAAPASAGTNGTLKICAGSSVSATSLYGALGGTPATGGTWSATTGGAGTYTYTQAATSPCTTPNTATVTVTEQALPASAGTNGSLIICKGTSVSESSLYAALGGTPATGGTWSATTGGAGTYTYTQAATSPCTTPNTATVTVTVTDGIAVQPVDTNICTTATTSLATISVVSYGGNPTYSWQYATALLPNTWNTISATNASTIYTTYNTANLNIKKSATLLTGNKYRVILTNGYCGTVTSDVVTLTVSPVAVIKTITPATTTVCSGTNSTLLTLGSGYVGTPQWQYSTTSATATDFAPINGATSDTYTATNLTRTTWFRVLLSSGACSATTLAVPVTVSPTAFATAIAGGDVCVGTAKVLTLPTGYVGTIQWQTSTDNNTFTPITGATAATYSVAATTVAGIYYYRAVLKSGACDSTTTQSVSVTVDPKSVAGTISGAATVCTGTNSTTLTLAGNTGNIQWQSASPLATSTYSNIYGATLTSYTASNLSATTFYKAVVTSGVCAAATTATAVGVTVSPTSVATTITGAGSTCFGTAKLLTLATGYVGTIQWQTSTDNNTFTPITGATAATYSVAATTVAGIYYYRAVLKSGACDSTTTQSVSVTVDPKSVAGTISGAATVCTGTNSTTLTLAGNTGNIQWQSASPLATSTYSNIYGATLTSYTASNLSATTFYKAVVTSGVCAAATTATAVGVTVSPTSVATTITGAGSTCFGTAKLLTLATGYVGTIQWQTSTDNNTFTPITGATAATYSVAATTVAGIYYYRAVLKSGACDSTTTQSVSVTVDPKSVAGTISGAATVCTGTNSTTLTLAGNTGNIQWQSASPLATSTYSNISGATLTSYTASNLSATTFYKAVVTSGVCAAVTTTTPVGVTVSPIAVATSVTGGDTTICNGATKVLTLATGTTGTIKWQSSATFSGTYSDIALATAATYTVPATLSANSTTYYRALLTSGACTASTTPVFITVGPVINAGTISGTAPVVCSGLTSTLTVTGFDSSSTIQWQSSATLTGTYVNVTTGLGMASASYTTAALTATTYYRANVSKNGCSSVSSGYLVTVSPAAKATAVTGNTGATTSGSAICTTATKALTLATGYAGSIQWQYYNAGPSATTVTNTTLTATWTDIQNATSATYNAASATEGNVWFRVKFTSSPCSAFAYSTPVNVWFKSSCRVVINNPTIASPSVAAFEVKAYPNPYTSAFQLDFTTSSENRVEIKVYDMIGKLIETRQFSTAEMNNQEVGNNYPSGIYNVIVTQGENMKTLRVIKR